MLSARRRALGLRRRDHPLFRLDALRHLRPAQRQIYRQARAHQHAALRRLPRPRHRRRALRVREPARRDGGRARPRPDGGPARELPDRADLHRQRPDGEQLRPARMRGLGRSGERLARAQGQARTRQGAGLCLLALHQRRLEAGELDRRTARHRQDQARFRRLDRRALGRGRYRPGIVHHSGADGGRGARARSFAHSRHYRRQRGGAQGQRLLLLARDLHGGQRRHRRRAEPQARAGGGGRAQARGQARRDRMPGRALSRRRAGQGPHLQRGGDGSAHGDRHDHGDGQLFHHSRIARRQEISRRRDRRHHGLQLFGAGGGGQRRRGDWRRDRRQGVGRARLRQGAQPPHGRRPGAGLGVDGHGPGHERGDRLPRGPAHHRQHARLPRAHHPGLSADRGRHRREQRSARPVRRQGGGGGVAGGLPAGADQCHRRRRGRALQRLAGHARPRVRGAGEATAGGQRARGRPGRLMDALPPFALVRPRTLDDIVKAFAEHPDGRLVGGGTDLVVNIRRGIVAPPVLIDVNHVAELRTIAADAETIEIGAAVTLAELAAHPQVTRHYPVLAQAADCIAGPTHRNMGTVGGNLCLDTRCLFYNQSEWWRAANNHCLKTTGDICHVAPKSRGICFATYSGDLAPALLTLGAEVDLAGPQGKRTLALSELYIGYSRQDRPITETLGDGKYYLALRAGEFVTTVRARNTPGLRSAYDKIRIRRSIEYPVTGVAVALRREGDTLADLRVAFTGTNPRPVLLAGTDALTGGALDARVFKGLDELVRDQIMSMKTTFTPGHYRRRVAGVLARRLVARLFAE